MLDFRACGYAVYRRAFAGLRRGERAEYLDVAAVYRYAAVRRCHGAVGGYVSAVCVERYRRAVELRRAAEVEVAALSQSIHGERAAAVERAAEVAPRVVRREAVEREAAAVDGEAARARQAEVAPVEQDAVELIAADICSFYV